MSFLRRQAALAALTANALRPPQGTRIGLPAFVAGWLTTELAPQVLALEAADTVAHLRRGRRSRLGLALAALNAAALAHMVRQAVQSERVVEEALVDSLGVDYAEADAPPTPAERAARVRRLVRPFAFTDPAVRVEHDVVFSEAGRRGMLDLYLPAREDRLDKAPVLLQVHGGGWTLGRKDQQGRPLMNAMAAKGWICVAINYRLAPRDPWPAQIVDVKRAIAWVKEHIAEYGGDPDYLVITGGSAGGHLSSLAALTPGDPEFQPGFEDADTSVQACVPHYGVYDFAGSTGLKNAVGMRDLFLGPRILKSTWQDAPDTYEAASPILRITPDAPDFFVLHGVVDSLVSVDQARLFVDRLRQVSRRSVVYAELPGAQHAYEVFHSLRSAHVVRGVERYLNWHWNTWRSGRAADSGVDPAALDGESA